jgi:hypothetical protein
MAILKIDCGAKKPKSGDAGGQEAGGEGSIRRRCCGDTNAGGAAGLRRPR